MPKFSLHLSEVIGMGKTTTPEINHVLFFNISLS